MLTNDQEANVIECRICHSKTTRDLILSPCLCKGSMGFVHIGCLEQWLNTSSHSFCELCSYRFEVRQVRRYTFCQSIAAWIRRDRNVLYKPLLFILFSSVNAILLCWMWYMWITNIARNEEDKKRNNEEMVTNENQDSSEIKYLVIFLFLTLLSALTIKGFCIDCYDVIKNQYDAWYQFWNESVNMQLILDLQNYKIKKEEANDILPNMDVEYQNIEDSNFLCDTKTLQSQEEHNFNRHTKVCGNSPVLPTVHKI